MSLENGGGINRDPRKIFNFFAKIREKIVRVTLGPSDKELQTIVGGASPTELRLFFTKSRDFKLRIMATNELVRRLDDQSNQTTQSDYSSETSQD